MSTKHYEGDTRTLSIETLEEILRNCFGWSDYDYECGGYHDNRWFSIQTVLEAVDRNI